MHKILKNTVFVYARTGYDALIAILVTAIIARYLSLSDFGYFALIMAFSNLVKILSAMGLNTIFLRELINHKDRGEEYYASVLAVQLALSCLTFIVITGGSRLFLSAVQSPWVGFIAALAVIFEFFGKTSSAVFQAHERMEVDFYKTFFSQTAYLGAVFYAAKLDLGLAGIFFALLVGNLCDMTFGFLAVSWGFLRLRPGLAKVSVARHLTREALPLGVRRLFRRASFGIDTFVLVALDSVAAAGLFSGPYKIAQNVVALAEGFSQAIFPVLIRRYRGGPGDSFNLAFEKSFKFVSIVGILLSLFFFSFPDQIIGLALGDKFLQATGTTRLLAGVIALVFWGNLAERILIVGGKQAYLTWIIGWGLPLNLVLDLALIPGLSINGAAIATLVAELAMTCMSYSYIKKHVTDCGVATEVLRPLMAGIVAAGLTYFIRPGGHVVAVVACLACYLTSLVLFGAFTREDFSLVRVAFKSREG